MANTLENSSPSRPVWLVADAVTLAASGGETYLVPCEGFDWCYIEVNCSTAITIYGVGNSGYGSSSYYFQVGEGGVLASRAVSAAAPYSLKFPCRHLASVGCQITNSDGANAGTLTVRIALAHE